MKDLERCFLCGEETRYDVSVGTPSWFLGDTSVPTCVEDLIPASILAYKKGLELLRVGVIEYCPKNVQVLRKLTEDEIKDWNNEIIARNGEVACPIDREFYPELSVKANLVLKEINLEF